MLYYITSCLNVTINYTVVVSLERVHGLSERRLCLRLFAVRFTKKPLFLQPDSADANHEQQVQIVRWFSGCPQSSQLTRPAATFVFPM